MFPVKLKDLFGVFFAKETISAPGKAAAHCLINVLELILCDVAKGYIQKLAWL